MAQGMTNEELLAQIAAVQKEMSAAVAEVRASVANANAAAATANAAANQAAAGAAAGVAGARTQSNVEGSTDAALKLLQQQVDSDVDTPEGIKAGVLSTTRAWNANEKRTYDLHQTFDMEVAYRNRLHFDASVTAYQSLVANLNHLNVVQMTNLQNQSNIRNLDAIVASKIGDDRMWNVNETDWAAVSMATFVNKVLAEMQKQSGGGSTSAAVNKRKRSVRKAKAYKSKR